MQRLAPFASLALFGSLSLGLAGCPIWTGGDDCRDCNVDTCFVQSDCPSGDVCGADNQCHHGDCLSYGCPSGEVCLTTVNGDSQCVSESGGSGQGGSSQGGSGQGGDISQGGSGGTGGAPAVVYCGNPSDCGDGQYCAPDNTCHTGDCSADGCIFGFICSGETGTPTCVSENPAACGSDSQCSGNDKCVSGICTAPSNQCFDQTQCADGSVCAAGKCVTSCDTATCASSYSCSADLNLCTTPVRSCTVTNDCGGPDSVCVDSACVPRSDMGTCGAGEVWVQNGCIPSQSAIFVCNVDGQQDACAAGSLCLHHSCYISCAAPNDMACSALPDFNVCKSVTTVSGDHPVCGSDQNLGSECDPTGATGVACNAGLICIDGFCR
ncbi:MAG: hypothetical protein U0271_04605 [Polyangiaceae bacterium]